MNKRHAFVITMALGLLAAELAFGALPRYEIIDLGTLGGSSSYPSDINDAGQVVGTSRTAEGTNGRVHGFLWNEVDGMIDMTELLDESSEWDYIESAIAINNNGQVGCRIHITDVDEPPVRGRKLLLQNYYLWDSETGLSENIASWSIGPGIMGEPIRAMNDSAEIVGISSSGYPVSMVSIPLPISYRACLWDSANGITDLGTLGEGSSNAFNINEAGEVVGASSTGFVYENGRDEVHAFLWDRINGMIDLGTLVDRNSSAWAVNNFQMVVGDSAVEVPDESRSTTINHAFVWTHEEGMIDIHDSSYPSSIALDINDSGQVVGIVSNSTFSNPLNGSIFFKSGILCGPSGCPPYSSAFLWDRINGMIDLNDILGEDSGWDYLRSAKAINNKGQIIGLGSINGQRHGFLLNPVIPIPADVQVRPRTINLSGNGKWIVCLVRLPEDYDVADVDTNSILLNGQIQPTRVWINEEDSVVMLKFNRSEVCDNLEAGKVELTVSGELVDGTKFEGTDTIRTIDRSRFRRSRGRHPGKPSFSKKQLKNASELVKSSISSIERVESRLLRLYDLAAQSSYGSYSANNRATMDEEFQTFLSMINPAVDRADYNGLNMLDLSVEIINVNIRNEVLRFPCVDITQSGLQLDSGLNIAIAQNAGIALAHLETSVQNIKEVDLQFGKYINTLAKYLGNIKPVLDKEVQLGLEIFEASKESAETTKSALDRAIDLLNESINGSHSTQQHIIMNHEFAELLNQCDRADKVYYGMGIVASTDILVIDTYTEILEFPGFDLTSAGLGLDIGLSIKAPENAQIAYPYIEAALQSVSETIFALDSYINTLSQYLQKKAKRNRYFKIRK